MDLSTRPCREQRQYCGDPIFGPLRHSRVLKKEISRDIRFSKDKPSSFKAFLAPSKYHPPKGKNRHISSEFRDFELDSNAGAWMMSVGGQTSPVEGKTDVNAAQRPLTAGASPLMSKGCKPLTLTVYNYFNPVIIILFSDSYHDYTHGTYYSESAHNFCNEINKDARPNTQGMGTYKYFDFKVFK